jgi:hypothetical protein
MKDRVYRVRVGSSGISSWIESNGMIEASASCGSSGQNGFKGTIHYIGSIALSGIPGAGGAGRGGYHNGTDGKPGEVIRINGGVEVNSAHGVGGKGGTAITFSSMGTTYSRGKGGDGAGRNSTSSTDRYGQSGAVVIKWAGFAS